MGFDSFVRSWRAMAIGAFVLACACSAKPPPSKFPTAEAALGRMKASYSCVYGVQGEGKLEHRNRANRVRGDVMFLAVNPQSVRFDIVSPFGVVLGTLTATEKKFAFFDMQNKVFFQGPPKPCNIARMTQVRLPAHALVQLLRGQAPLLAHAPSDAMIHWDGHGYYVVQIRGAHEAEERIHLNPYPSDWSLPWSQQRIQVLSVEVTQRDYVHFHADLLDYEMSRTMPAREDELGIDPPIPPSGPVCEARVPRRIHVTVPYTADDLKLRYEQIGLNPPLPQGVFEQQMPDGVRSQFVTCQGR